MKKILIHKDARGVIYRIEIGDVYFNLMTRKKGTLLSGDFHPYTQYDLILKGEFKITLRKNKKDVVIKKKANEFISIPPNTPHLFESLTDTITIEWWDGPFEQKIYKPYRKLVDENIKTFNDQ
ncbi:hypothetical protein KAJ61_00085 [Candidatus Parcubacteria bacterium]|nr:hypothetical protein [Candidatus Parcubacteria bacterium]